MPDPAFTLDPPIIDKRITRSGVERRIIRKEVPNIQDTKGISDNGPFDPRITSIPFLQDVKANRGSFTGGMQLARGFIIQEKPVNGIRHRCNFLYNPSVINVTHGVDTNIIGDQNAQTVDDVTAGHLLLPLAQGLQFDLLFDRTYELWDPSNLYGKARDMVPQLGVVWDIAALYRITGIAARLDVTDDGQPDTEKFVERYKNNNFEYYPVGPMVWTPVYVVIGSTLSYYGVIESLAIQYVHWTQAMIPSRCQVTVGVKLLPTSSTPNKYVASQSSLRNADNWGDPLSDSELASRSVRGGGRIAGVAGR